MYKSSYGPWWSHIRSEKPSNIIKKNHGGYTSLYNIIQKPIKTSLKKKKHRIKTIWCFTQWLYQFLTHHHIIRGWSPRCRQKAVHDGITEDLHGAAKGDLFGRSVQMVEKAGKIFGWWNHDGWCLNVKCQKVRGSGGLFFGCFFLKCSKVNMNMYQHVVYLAFCLGGKLEHW